MDADDRLILDDIEDEDPFALFDEWASPADVEAFESLVRRE